MAQQVTEGTGVILAGSFPRRRDGGTHLLPTPGASGSRRSRQSWESAGAWVKARLAFLVVRMELQEGFVAAVRVQAVGWSPSPHSASPSVLLAPLRCALAQTKPNCLYLFVGSDDAGGGVKQANEEILPCSCSQEDGSSCSRQDRPGSECSHE